MRSSRRAKPMVFNEKKRHGMKFIMVNIRLAQLYRYAPLIRSGASEISKFSPTSRDWSISSHDYTQTYRNKLLTMVLTRIGNVLLEYSSKSKTDI